MCGKMDSGDSFAWSELDTLLLRASAPVVDELNEYEVVRGRGRERLVLRRVCSVCFHT